MDWQLTHLWGILTADIYNNREDFGVDRDELGDGELRQILLDGLKAYTKYMERITDAEYNELFTPIGWCWDLIIEEYSKFYITHFDVNVNGGADITKWTYYKKEEADA